MYNEGELHGPVTRLHPSWTSGKNPQKGSCVKLFVVHECYASASVTAAVEPTGEMVVHKVLLTSESPQDEADSVLAGRVTPMEGGGHQGLSFTSIRAMYVCHSDSRNRKTETSSEVNAEVCSGC